MYSDSQQTHFMHHVYLLLRNPDRTLHHQAYQAWKGHNQQDETIPYLLLGEMDMQTGHQRVDDELEKTLDPA